MSAEVEEIKKRLDIAETIGAYMPLVRAGGANMKARCPFHQEKTPSFYISRDRQMWHCFGCGEGGDIFTFVMRIEGLEFRDALRLLADKAGVKLPDWKPEASSEWRRLLDALALSQRFFAAMLADAPQAAHAREYVAKRGISDETRKAFGIGYAPAEWDGLLRALVKRGVAPLDIEKAGMVVRRERGSGHYDRFRDRLMFPIRDVNGQTLGFTGRVLQPDAKEAKYVNTPQTAIYDKSSALYGIDLARQSIRERDLAVLVEGNVDVISCHQAGFTNVVAASGTALTEEQLRLLGRFTRNLSIAFDADSAGAAAARRGMDLALAQGFTVRVITLPEGAGKDPDDCVRKDPELWRQAVEGSVHVMEYLIRRLTAGKRLDDPVAKRTVGNELLAEIARLPDAIEQSHWLQRVSSLISVPESVLREQMAKVSASAGARKPVQQTPGAAPAASAAPAAPAGRDALTAKTFMAILFAKPEMAKDFIGNTPIEAIPEGPLRDLYTVAVAGYTQGGMFPPQEIPGQDGAVADTAGALLRELLLLGERDYAPLASREAEAELTRIAASLRENWRKRRLEALKLRMDEAERSGDAELVSRIEQEVRELMLPAR